MIKNYLVASAESWCPVGYQVICGEDKTTKKEFFLSNEFGSTGLKKLKQVL